MEQFWLMVRLEQEKHLPCKLYSSHLVTKFIKYSYFRTGATENFKHRGIIPRSIAQTFKEISDRPDSAYTVRISYVEIYKETMIDLLSNLSEDNKSSNQFTVVEEKNGIFSLS